MSRANNNREDGERDHHMNDIDLENESESESEDIHEEDMYDEDRFVYVMDNEDDEYEDMDDEIEEDSLYLSHRFGNEDDDYSNDDTISDLESDEENNNNNKIKVDNSKPNTNNTDPTDNDMKDFDSNSIHSDKIDLFINMIKSPGSYSFSETFNEDFISFISNSDPFILEKYLEKLKVFMLSSENKNLYEEIKNNQKVSTCGKIFKNNDWGYQCDTCCLDATSIYCQDCFKASDHKGHKFHSSRTGAGGCCDCGDKDSILESGFCSKHQDIEESDEDLFKLLGNMISKDHITKCEFLLGSLLDNLIYVLSSKPILKNEFYRNRYPFYSHKPALSQSKDLWGVMIYNDETHSFEDVVGCLKKNIAGLSNSQAFEFAHYVHMNDRCVVYTGSKEDATKISKKIQDSSLKSTITQRFTLFPILNLKIMIEFFSYLSELSCFKRIFCNVLRLKPGIYQRANKNKEFDNLESEKVRLSLFMDKISKLPEGSIHLLKDWLFSLTFDRSFKLDFSRCFVKSYSKISSNYVKDIFPYDSSFLSMTVQIFTIPNLSSILASKYNSPSVIYSSLQKLVKKNGISNDKKLSFQSTLNYSQRRTFKKCQLMISDFHHTLSTKPILKNLLLNGSSTHLLHWLEILNLYHLANPNIRSLLEFKENEEWSSYFTDYVFLAKYTNTILNSLIIQPSSDIKSDDIIAIKESFKIIIKAVKEIQEKTTNGGISFHIPIHRALTLCALIMTQNFSPQGDTVEFFFNQLSSTTSSISKKLLYGVASIDNLISESNSKMWLKNGSPIVQQIHNYLYHQHLRSYLADFDLFLKQICLCSIGSGEFIQEYLSYFTHIQDLKKICQHSIAFNYSQAGVLSNFLYNLIVILTDRSFIGDQNKVELLENDIIHSLIAKPLTYSVLATSVSPEIRGLNVTDQDFEDALKNVSNFQPPSAAEPGKYALKQEYYCRYNRYYFRFSSGEREKSEDTLNSIYSKSSSLNPRLLRVPKLTPLRKEFKEINNIYTHESIYELIFHSLYQSIQDNLDDPVSLDQQDTQQRILERSDIIAHILHLIYLSIDQIPIQVNNDNNNNSNYSIVSNGLLNNYKANLSSIDLLLKIFKDESKSYFHITIKSILQVLSSKSSEITEKIKLACPNDIITKESNIESKSPPIGLLGDQDKKKKAEEARQKILQQFSQQQKSFIRNSNSGDKTNNNDDNYEDDEDDDEIQYSSEIKGTCILCRESTPINDKVKPIGSLCNIQSSRLTNIMQLRSQLNFDPNYYYVKNHQNKNSTVGKDSEKEFYIGEPDEPNSSKDSTLNTNVFIKSCGHLMHIQCFENLFQNVQTFVHCPLCGVYSNALLPNEIKNFSPFSNTIEKSKYSKDIENSRLSSLYRDFGDRLRSKLKSIKSFQISGGAPLSHSVSSTISLLEFSSRSSSKLLSSSLDYKQIQSLKSVLDSVILIEMSSNSTGSVALPTLSKMEPFDYLTSLIISSNSTIEQSQYKSNLLSLINTIVIRSIISVINNDQDKNNNETSKDIKYIAPIGSNSFGPSQSLLEILKSLYETIKISMNNNKTTTTTTTTTSSQNSQMLNNIWDKITSELVIFLRKVSVLEAIYLNTTIPSFELKCDMLSNYVDQMIEHIGLDSLITDSSKLLLDETNQNSIKELIGKEFIEITSSGDDQEQLYNHLISNSPSKFELLPIPNIYDEFLQLKLKCLKCKTAPLPEDQALCLGCGRMLCLGKRCCRYGLTNEISLHAQKCIGDMGIYLLIDQCVVIAVYEDSLSSITTPYLDEHGEEDIGLKRGIPLHFIKERYQNISNTISKHEILVSKTNTIGNIRNQI